MGRFKGSWCHAEKTRLFVFILHWLCHGLAGRSSLLFFKISISTEYCVDWIAMLCTIGLNDDNDDESDDDCDEKCV